MNAFNQAGHLTDEALEALVRGDPLAELERLEVGEHLAFCDICLSRYTEHLTDDALLTPALSCQKPLWQRIHARALRIFTSRYATAAAGVALMVAVLWGSAGLAHGALPALPPELPALSQQMQAWPQQWSESLGDIFSHMTAFFGQTGATAPQGGSR